MKKTFRVEGMTCSGCARAVENAIKNAAPMTTVEVDLDAKQVTVDGIEASTLAETVKAAVEGAGFTYAGVA